MIKNQNDSFKQIRIPKTSLLYGGEVFFFDRLSSPSYFNHFFSFALAMNI